MSVHIKGQGKGKGKGGGGGVSGTVLMCYRFLEVCHVVLSS